MAYELPVAAAHARLFPERGQKRDDHLANVQHERADLALGRKQAALVLAVAGLKHRDEEHLLSTPQTWRKQAVAITSGFVLCERVTQTFVNISANERTRLDVQGLLLDTQGTPQAYETSLLVRNTDDWIDRNINVDAWGLRRNQLGRSSKQLPCDNVTQLDILAKDDEFDRQIGAIAAPLNFDDLLAGLAARYRVDVPALETVKPV